MPRPPKKPWFRKFRQPGERSTLQGEHVPVMLAEVLAALDPKPGHVVVDCTLGFAGHAVELLRRIGPTGQLVALDLDADNLPRAKPLLETVGHPFSLHHANFAGLPTVLAGEGIEQVHGLLADLGMSSMQVDDPSRGFSFMRDGPLDMRMDRTRGKTAADLLNTLPPADLVAAFTELGDEPEAEKIVASIVAARQKKPLERTSELRDLIRHAAPVRPVRGPGAPPERKQLLLPTTRVFQALRILVNRELANLQQLLRVLPSVLKPGATAALISFHSGEDRLIKAAFRDGLRAGMYAAVSDDPVRPSETEKATNPRSRSAKLRWAQKS
jgi:16S rRNA (cytosine1402-N4)-methyltransferase